MSRYDATTDWETAMNDLEPLEDVWHDNIRASSPAVSNSNLVDTFVDHIFKENCASLPGANGSDQGIEDGRRTSTNWTDNTGENAHHDKAALENDDELKTIVLEDDLKDWLDFTGWNDVEFRSGYLVYHRTSRSVSQKKAALEAEEAKLRQYQQYGRTQLKPPQAARSTRDTVPATEEYFAGNQTAPSAIGDLNDDSYDNHHNVTTQHRITYKGERLNTPQQPLLNSPFLRNESSNGSVSFDLTGNDQGEWRAPTPNQARQMTPDTKPNTNDGAYNRRSRSPTSSIHKVAWPRIKHSVKQANTLFTERREYRNGRGELFKPIALGNPGDTRFFVVRSYCIENVKDSMEDGMWASKHDNARKLVDAFNKCDNIILIFGANQTRQFQGYARMTGIPSAELPRPKWYEKIKWPISQPFTIDWISKRGIDDNQARALKNSLNEDLPVTRSRDCQELDDYCGRAVIDLLNQEAMKN